MSENPPNTFAPLHKLLSTSQFEQDELRRDLAEKVQRECEALRMYQPLLHQTRLHESRTRTVIMRKANQVGGTLSFAVEIARAVTGQDPFHKYPKRDGVACILGYGERHIGDVFYPKLFKAGAFDIIKDKVTGTWRTYRPWPEAEGGDMERQDEVKPAPPLIPPRFLASEPAWVSKKDRIFASVQLTTGWELRAYNSAGDPGQAQGFIADLYGVDEDTATTGWIEEILFRLVKKRGLLRWTAKPHGKNDEMLKLLDKAEQELQDGGKQTVEVIHATLYDNKYISKESIEETASTARAMGEDVYRERVLGELNIDSLLMYPTFGRRLHDVMNVTPNASAAQKILAERMGDPPHDWCCFAIVDPGSQVMAVEFLTIPPPELGEQVFVYDELYIRQGSTEAFGNAMQEKCADRTFQAFYMDYHGGKLRGTAGGEWPIDLYRDAMAERGVKSVQTEHGFWPGCDDIKRREEAMRLALALNRSGQPGVMIVAGKCPMLMLEMERFRKKTVQHAGKPIPLDEGNRKGFTHAIECLEMGLGLDLEYAKPQPKTVDHSWLDNALTWGERQKRRTSLGQRILGKSPTISLGPIGART